MAELIKRFIVWYLRYKCNAMFEYKGFVIRAFSEEFYETELRDYINAVARARHNTRTPKETHEKTHDNTPKERGGEK